MDELSLKQGQFRGKFSNEEPRKGLFTPALIVREGPKVQEVVAPVVLRPS